jgi:hypothetical protein
MHGGAKGSGGQPGNQHARRHGLASIRLELRKTRREIEEHLRLADDPRHVLDPERLALQLADDARRLLARVEQIESRADTLSDVGRLTPAAEAEAMRNLISCERAITAVRAVWSTLLGRFPAAPELTEEQSE